MAFAEAAMTTVVHTAKTILLTIIITTFSQTELNDGEFMHLTVDHNEQRGRSKVPKRREWDKIAPHRQLWGQ